MYGADLFVSIVNRHAMLESACDASQFVVALFCVFGVN